MQQSLVEHALAYASHGWAVFPIKEKTKVPLTVRGFKDASTDPATIKAWWLRWPTANIGIPTGDITGLAVVDVDPRHGGEVSLERLISDNGPLPDTLEGHTGGGGRHLCFQFTNGFRNSAGDISPGIDTRGEGGYIVVPPSVTTGTYEWEGGEGPAEKPLAPLPDWLKPGYAKVVIAPDGAGNLSFDATTVKAKANGEPVSPGGRNMATASLAGQFITAGDTVSTALAKVKAWNRENPQPLSDSETEKTVASVACTHARNNPGQSLAVGDIPVDIEVIEVKLANLIAQPFPSHLLNPPGFVGEICRWINDSAYKPQPILSMANTMAFFGAVIGRKVRTPSDLRTNLYCLGVGESGCGKDHSRRCIKVICEFSGLTSELLGGEEVSSDTAVLSALSIHPSLLFQFDEIGHFLANANSKYAQSHQKNIAPTFTKLFSSASTTYIGKAYATTERKDIVQPNVCLYGTTVPSRLYDGLTPNEISDGFLGRMLVFKSNDPDPLERDVAMSPVPDSIIKMVQAWHGRKDLPQAPGNLGVLRHVPITVPFESEATAVLTSFRDRCRHNKADSRKVSGMGLDVLWSRAVEHARKVALVIACGCEFGTPIVSGDIAEWAVSLVEFLVSDLIGVVKDSVAGSEFERDLLYVLRQIRESGPNGVNSTQLSRRTQRLNPRTRTDILNQLVLSTKIVKRESKPARGPSAINYVAL